MSCTLERLASTTAGFGPFPTGKSERWRFSQIGKWLERPFSQASSWHDTAPEASCDIVVDDGIVVQQRLPEGVRAVPVSGDDAAGHPDNLFARLNAAHGVALGIDVSAGFAGVLQILYRYGAGIRHSRLNVRIDNKARCTLVERFVGAGEGFVTHHTALTLEPSCHLQHMQIQDLDPTAAMVGETLSGVAKGAEAEYFYLARGAAFHQHFYAVSLAEEATGRMRALLLGRDNQRQVLCTDFDHRKPRSSSDQLSRQILRGGSVAVFDGKARIDRGASGSEALQGTHTLLLSDEAQVHAKPHLEIYTDDLKASHGATVGQLDEGAMLYLQSRGIPEAVAREMLIEAFASDLFETIGDEALRAQMQAYARSDDAES